MKFKISKIIDRERIKKVFLFFKNLPWIIGENVFFFFIVMIFIAIAFGVFFFVKNIVLIERRIPMISSQLPALDEKTLERILGKWQLRQDKFDGVNSKTYPDLFLPKSE